MDPHLQLTQTPLGVSRPSKAERPVGVRLWGVRFHRIHDRNPWVEAVGMVALSLRGCLVVEGWEGKHEFELGWAACALGSTQP